MSQYTFSALTVGGERTYPLQFKWEDPQCPPHVGMLDFLWTPNIKFARTWPEQDMVETIAIEFYNAEIIEIDENGEYKVIKTME